MINFWHFIRKLVVKRWEDNKCNNVEGELQDALGGIDANMGATWRECNSCAA